MEDFFLELNTPGAREAEQEKKSNVKKKPVDPLVQAKQAGQSDAEKRKNPIRDRIVNRKKSNE